MLNSVLDKIKKRPFTTLFFLMSLIVILLFINIQLTLLPKTILLDDYSENKDIVFEVTNIYSDKNFVIIEGYSYNIDAKQEYSNYISGKGISYKINNRIFIGANNEFKTLYTTPFNLKELYDKNMNYVGYTGFLSKVRKSEISMPFYIGVLVEGKEYKIISESFTYE